MTLTPRKLVSLLRLSARVVNSVIRARGEPPSLEMGSALQVAAFCVVAYEAGMLDGAAATRRELGAPEVPRGPSLFTELNTMMHTAYRELEGMEHPPYIEPGDDGAAAVYVTAQCGKCPACVAAKAQGGAGQSN